MAIIFDPVDLTYSRFMPPFMVFPGRGERKSARVNVPSVGEFHEANYVVSLKSW